uniref:CARD domain-containing protein n=1 Tax=Sander lucioperca TaxID=283035 RepID=A0A8D0D520_SANLU
MTETTSKQNLTVAACHWEKDVYGYMLFNVLQLISYLACKLMLAVHFSLVNVFRTQFVERVSDPVLNQLLDKLLERGVITDGEMQSVRTGRADKARDVMDTVRRKGSAASSVLISALCEVDPVLSRELRLI